MQALSLFLLLASLPLSAAAQSAPGDSASAPRAPEVLQGGYSIEDSVPLRKRDNSITFSPFHLPLRVLEVTAERRLWPHFGAAVIGGLGAWGDGSNGEELGLQVRYYPGPLYGPQWHIGLEGFVAHVYTGSTPEREDDGFLDHLFEDIDVLPYGGGPFVGVKGVAANGFTAEFQAGIQCVALLDESGYGFGPILNLNFGYSF